MTSLRRRAQANAPAASYWLRRVVDDAERRPRLDEFVAKWVPGRWGRSLQCTAASFRCTGPVLLITEFAPCGSLRDYLRQHRDREPADDVTDDVTSGDDSRTLAHGDLLTFAVQAARALQFLASQLASVAWQLTGGSADRPLLTDSR